MKQKQVFGFRKSKAYKTLCGAVLGTALFVLGAQIVHADEAQTEKATEITTSTAEKSSETKAETEKSVEEVKKAEESKEAEVKEKTKIEVEKVAKAAPKVNNPNPEPSEPKQPEFKPEVKKTTATVEKTADPTGSSKVDFTAKSNVSSSQSKEHVPMDLIKLIDVSGSLSDGEYKQRNGVAGARRQQINDMIYTIEKRLAENDQVMLAFSGTNKKNSYAVGGQDGGIATRLMSKQEALTLLKAINAETRVHEMAQSWELIPKVIKPLLNKYVADVPNGTGFEDVYKAQPNKNKVVSVLQFTDNWTIRESEDIDNSFADWAKSNAKTFMTVVDDPDPDNSLSVSQMKKAGHPNIQTFKRLDEPGRQETIAKLFESTAMVTKTTVTKQKGDVSVVASKGLTLTSAKLTAPDGKVTDLTIKDGKATYTGELIDGKYTLSYTYSGEGTVSSTALLDGKEAAKRTDTLQAPSGTIKADYRTQDGKELKATATISQAGKVVGTDWQAPVADKTITVNGQVYVLVGTPVQEAGKTTKDNVTLHYVYQAKPADKKVYNVTFKVINALTGQQIDKVFTVAKGFEGSDYSTLAPTVDGFNVTLKEGAAKGKFGKQDIVLTYVAHEKGEEVKAIFVDENGKALKDPAIIAKAGELIGTDWKFDGKVEKEITIDGETYVLQAVPEIQEGKVSADKQTLKFVYKKKAKPTKKALPKTSAVKASNTSASADSAGMVSLVLASAVVGAYGVSRYYNRKTSK